MALFELTNDYLRIPKGTQIEADKETEKFITVEFDKKSMVIPRAFVKPATDRKKYSKPDDTELADELGVGPEEKVVEPPPPPPKPIKLKKDQFFLSSVTEGVLPTSGIDHVLTKVNPKDFTPDQLTSIPKIDPDFVWDANLLESMWMSHLLNKKMLITGWPGTGKTSAVRQLAALLGHPYLRFNGKDGIEASSFLGMIWATRDGMEWRDGLMPQGVRGGYMVTIDEVMKIPNGIQMSLQNLYEENGYLTLDDKPGSAEEKEVHPHKMFRMFLTDNVKGTGDNFDKFSATQVQDTSTIDRFGITATLDYLPKKREVEMLKKKYPKVEQNQVERLVTFAGLIRNAYIQSEISLTLSPRGLQTICELLEYIPDVKRCIHMSYMDSLGEQDEIDAVKEMMRTIW